jgi:hypothetical protein
MEKLCSQHFSSFFKNESIMVTSRFFVLFSRPDWDFGKMDILKNVQNRFLNVRPEKVIFYTQ